MRVTATAFDLQLYSYDSPAQTVARLLQWHNLRVMYDSKKEIFITDTGVLQRKPDGQRGIASPWTTQLLVEKCLGNYCKNTKMTVFYNNICVFEFLCEK